ncbi:MAG TPA: glycosyltransferase family 2 protein [Burkholderiaceae bacterium]|nr:glycosyltransferase family 2 protein [Burkholderiaceae bacterium]
MPVYRGARTIGAVVEAIAGLRIEGGHGGILVNDGSPDDSAQVCRALTRRTDVEVTLVDLSRNFGEHNAVLAGLRHARGEFVVTMDDDLQNPIEEAVRLYRHARDGGWDVVYSRYPRKRHAAWRNLGSRFANRVADWLLDKPPGLYLSSFRCIARLVVDHVTRFDGPLPYVDGLILQAAGRIDSLEVAHRERAEGRSNYTVRKLVRLWLNLFVGFSVKPLRVATATGLACTALGALATVAIVVEALRGGTPAGWASLAAMTLVVSGLQLGMLGVIGGGGGAGGCSGRVRSRRGACPRSCRVRRRSRGSRATRARRSPTSSRCSASRCRSPSRACRSATSRSRRSARCCGASRSAGRSSPGCC